MNVRYFSHAFINIDTAPLIVTNAVLSTLCKSLPMNRNAECFHECFRDVVCCQVTLWSMTSLNATHVTLYSVLRVQNFILSLHFQTMLIVTEFTGLYEHDIVLMERSHPLYAQVKSVLNAVSQTNNVKVKMATNRRNRPISFFRRNAARFQRPSLL